MPLKVDPQVETAQHERLAMVRSRRDEKQVLKLLDKLEVLALRDDNLMPIFIECVEGDVTLGEICNRLRQLWGEYHAPPIL